MGKRALFFVMVAWVMVATSLFAGGAAARQPEEPSLMMIFSAGGSGRTLQNSAERFAQETGVRVEVLQFPITETFDRQVLALSQRQPQPDVISIDDVWFDAFQRYLEPINVGEDVLGRFVPSMIDPFIAPDGSVRALPVRMGGDVIMYRIDVFREHGIDPNSIRTWEDVKRVAAQITDPRSGRYGWTQGYAPIPSTLTAFLNYLSSHGARLLNDDASRAAFNTPEGVRALQTMIDISNAAGPPGLVNFTYHDQVESLQTGTAVMGLVWNPRFTAIDSPDFPHSGKFGVLPNFPHDAVWGGNGVGRVYGWGLGINASSRNKELAQRFIEFVSSEEEQLRLALEWDNSPTTLSVFENEQYLSTIPVAREMASAMRYSIGRPDTPHYSEIVDIVGVQLQRAVTGEISAQRALEIAEQQANEILR